MTALRPIHQDLSGANILSLPAENTLDFLEVVFDCYQAKQLFAIIRPDVDPSEYGLEVRQVRLGGARKGWGRLDYNTERSDDPAQIVFTSGTEGRPKAIVLSHCNLADVVERLNAAMQVTNEIREYIGVPVTYSFGLGRVRAVAAAGGTFFLPQRFDPVEIRQMLEAGEINAISAVPSLWQVVLAAPQAIGEAGQHVRWIEIGSQYMTAADKAAMARLFPNARIIQHYGLTEASRTTFLDISASAGEVLESVGYATGSVELKITEEGAIAIRGNHGALGRLDEKGRLIPLTEKGWLITRDRGEIRDGCLYYLGRLDDQINVSGIKLGAEALEVEIATLVPAAAGRFAIVAVPDQMRGEAVLLALEEEIADHGALIAEAAKLSLERHGISAGGVLKRLTMPELPRTGTNKIRRREIRQHYHPEAVNQNARSPLALSEAEAQVAASWAAVLGTNEIGAAQSFFDLGGDSLSSMQIGLAMEASGFARSAVRATLEGRPLSEVAKLVLPEAETTGGGALPRRTVQGWGLSITRGIMALSVLLSHWGPGFFGRLGLEREAEAVLSIFYRMGTPGFAAVFGMGVGFFMLAEFADKRASVLARMRSSFRLVAGGLLLLALSKLALSALRGEEINSFTIAQDFYGVLAYYAVMLGTAPWWLPTLARMRSPVLSLIAIALGCWLLWQVSGALLPSVQVNNPLEWVRLMLAAGYNVFKLSAVAAVGAAAGWWLASQQDVARAGRQLLTLGCMGMVFALAVIVQAHGVGVFRSRGGDGVYVSLPGLALYLSLALLFLGAGLSLVRRWQVLPVALQSLLKLLIVVGGLALPIYVFHQLVIPIRSILVQLGLPGTLALTLAMGSFLVAMAYAGRRLWKMYF